MSAAQYSHRLQCNVRAICIDVLDTAMYSQSRNPLPPSRLRTVSTCLPAVVMLLLDVISNYDSAFCVVCLVN